MTQYAIDVFDETEELTEKEKHLVLVVIESAIESELLRADSEISMTFVTDERIHELNKEYRDKDMATDVLTFALNDDDREPLNLGVPNLLGDIVISVPRAKEQAIEYGHDFQRELCFLAVHGFLHLIGYDHESEAEENIMFTKQEDILEKHGLKK